MSYWEYVSQRICEEGADKLFINLCCLSGHCNLKISDDVGNGRSFIKNIYVILFKKKDCVMNNLKLGYFLSSEIKLIISFTVSDMKYCYYTFSWMRQREKFLTRQTE